MKTFICDFGKGLKCTLRTLDRMPEQGTTHIIGVAWTKRPHMKNYKRYVKWINSINMRLANEWGKRIMHVFLPHPMMNDPEVWIYEPNKPPERLDLSCETKPIQNK
jgi:hypothetical protein